MYVFLPSKLSTIKSFLFLFTDVFKTFKTTNKICKDKQNLVLARHKIHICIYKEESTYTIL